MNRQLVVALLALGISSSASAAALSCSTKASKLTSAAEMKKLAKVTQAEAQKTALAELKAPSARVKKGKLEAEDGCLVYSFDIAIPGKSGIEEILIDAGTGKVLSQTHERK